MGQNQPKNDGAVPSMGRGKMTPGAAQQQDVIDRSNANFKNKDPMNNNPKATGMGNAGIPGKPI